jgi:hypothetical protein
MLAAIRRAAPAALSLRFASTGAAATMSSKTAHLRDVATPRAPRELSEEAREVKDNLRRFDFGRPKSRSSGSFAGPALNGAGSQGSHSAFSHANTESATVLHGQ